MFGRGILPFTNYGQALLPTCPARNQSHYGAVLPASHRRGGQKRLHRQTSVISVCPQVYYREISKALKAVTGAKAVQIFHHQIRNPERSNGSSSNVNTSVQGYASRIHLDTAPFGCQETFKHFLNQTEEPKLRQGRFMVLNAWRNISDLPIQRDHLALLDETSTVKPDDYIIGDFFGNVRQTWYLSNVLH